MNNRKDNILVIGGDLPELLKEPSECENEESKFCSKPSDISLMKKFLEHKNIPLAKKTSDEEIIELLKNLLEVSKESKIWENNEFKDFVGEDRACQILQERYNPKGPANSTELLDNFNIDEKLEQWSKRSKELFNKKFYHVPFQMIDFQEKNTDLANLSLWDLIQNKYDCFGVVLNTDVSSGRGKHWFCIYGDLDHDGTEKDPYTLEYFNSSGNPPMSQVEIWMQKVVHDLMRDHHKKCDIIRSAPKRIQKSHTECGVFSLMYIKSRLQGHPHNWFYTVKVNDQDMINLRKHLFRE